ncbi:MAG: hypothetical protein AAFU79_35115 [Myxococcota bacterium]
MKIAWVSCLELPEPDPDEGEGLATFRARGHDVEVVAWDDPELQLEGFDLALLRSTWNYPRRPEAFRQFLTQAPDHLWNPSRVGLWNMHKGYLLELERGGVPIVPTALGRPGEDAGALARARGWSEVVVKPAVGADSIGVQRFADLDAATAHGHTLAGDFLVQPALAAFGDPGERSLIWVHGVFTHTIVKGLRLSGDHEAIRLVGPEPSPEAQALGRQALAFAPADLLYARVDYIHHEGRLLLSELELIEPSLFWSLGGAATASAEQLVRGVEALGRAR